MSWAELYRKASETLGVVDPRSADAAGVPRSTFVNRARREGWPEPFPRTFVLPGWPVNGLARTVAAALWAGDGAYVTGRSALALHGLIRTPPSTVELLVASNRRRIDHPRIRTRWTGQLDSASIALAAGTQVTDVARSLAELAASATTPHLRAVAIDATVRGLLTVKDMDREIESRERFAGRGRYRRIRADLEGDGSDSGFEFEARDRLIASGVPPDPEQAEVETATTLRRIDIAYRREGVGIECLGFAYHSSPQALENDVLRSNDIAALDRWLLLGLTFAMFHQRWEPFLAQLRHCLEQRGWQAP